MSLTASAYRGRRRLFSTCAKREKETDRERERREERRRERENKERERDTSDHARKPGIEPKTISALMAVDHRTIALTTCGKQKKW